jgi:hypothetical protein
VSDLDDRLYDIRDKANEIAADAAELIANDHPSGLDVERLAVAMNDAQVTCDEIRLGHDLGVPAARIAAAYARLTEHRA